MTNWQNRIIGLEMIPAHQLTAHPLNARRHPAKQREALRGSLDTIGWYDAVILNKTTGFIIDGHARVEEQLTKNEDALIPVLIVDMTEAEEAQALASHDFISLMAEYDRETLSSLLSEVHTDDERIQTLMSELEKTAGIYDLPSLEDLEDVYGEPESEDFWPVIRVQVSPDLYEKFLSVTTGKDDGQRLIALLESL